VRKDLREKEMLEADYGEGQEEINNGEKRERKKE
jgi:hypothetical protein